MQRTTVAVRVRPLNLYERASPDVRTIVRCVDTTRVVVDPMAGLPKHHLSHLHKPRSGDGLKYQRAQEFTFDRVFNSYATQEEVYEGCGAPVVDGLFAGINAAILAYGATGSGKTHTMLGSDLSSPGIVLQCARDVFAKKRNLDSAGTTTTITVSYLEIYNEQVRDLFAPAINGKLRTLNVRADTQSADKTVEVDQLTSHVVDSLEAFKELLDLGIARRFVATTVANAESSRSHAILEIRVEVMKDHQTSMVAKLKLCDLAGSERAASSNNVGIRLKEGGNINKSLLALGAVVQALAARKKDTFIPYRGSKLTRILKDCLGGNCNTMLLVTVSPNSKASEETLNSLYYGTQAQQIECVVRCNEVKSIPREIAEEYEQILRKLNEDNATLRQEVALLRSGGFAPVAHTFVAAPRAPTIDSGCQSISIEPSSVDVISVLRSEYGFDFNQFRAERDEAYEDFKRCHEGKDVELETEIRSQRFKIASYLVHCHNMDNPPIGISTAHQTIASLEAALNDNRQRRATVMDRIDALDNQLKVLRERVFSSPSKPPEAIHLMLEVAKLQTVSSTAELLATQYFQHLARAEQRERERMHALELCMDVLRKIDPVRDGLDQSIGTSIANAIAFAALSSAPTEKMIDEFNERLRDRTNQPVPLRRSVRLELCEPAKENHFLTKIHAMPTLNKPVAVPPLSLPNSNNASSVDLSTRLQNLRDGAAKAKIPGHAPMTKTFAYKYANPVAALNKNMFFNRVTGAVAFGRSKTMTPTPTTTPSTKPLLKPMRVNTASNGAV